MEEKKTRAARVHSEETKEKMRLAASGKIQSPETIAKRVDKITGMKRSPEHSAAQSERQKGRFISEETKLKIAESTKQYMLSIQKPKIEINGTKYNSVDQASKSINLGRKAITARLKSEEERYKDWIYLQPHITK